MSSSTKVFIYNGQGASEESAEDLKELLSSRDIFPNGVDITLTRSFFLNMRNSRHATFVMPAGSTFMMSVNIRPALLRIQREIGTDFNYVGVCAGGFLALDKADVFHTMDDTTNIHHHPKFLESLNPSYNVGIVNQYTGMGPFLPNDTYVGKVAKLIIPYRVNLALTEQAAVLPQLYVDGPGFVPTVDSPSLKAVASISRHDGFSFFKSGATTKIFSLSSILAKPADAESGARVLSTTHFETCVPNSKFLKLFQAGGKTWEKLNDEDYNAFVNEQESSRNTVVKLLHETLKPR